MDPDLRRGAVVLPGEALAADEELWIEDGGDDHSGWYCVRTDPFPCPANGCTFVADFMTAAHLVLVWEERDDPNLLCTRSGRRRSGGTLASWPTRAPSGRARRTTPGRRRAARCMR